MVKFMTLWFCGMLPVFAMSQTLIRESIGSVATTYSSDRFDLQACVGLPYNSSVVNSSGHRPGFIQPQTTLTTFKKLISIKLYPNPTFRVLNFSFDNELANVTVVVTDLLGNVVYNQYYVSVSSGFTDCSAWSSGMYFIQIRQNDHVLVVGRIVKINKS